MRVLGSGIYGEGGASIERSLFPSEGRFVSVTSPAALDEADELVIDEDAFHFSAFFILDTDDDTDDFAEWESSLPFSEIAELRFDPATEIVSGTLKDGSELNFEIGFSHALKRMDPPKEAMQAVAALFAPESSVPTPDRTGADAEGPLVWWRSLDVVFLTAALGGTEAQMRRFAHITSAAGLDVATFTNSQLSALWPGTVIAVVEMSAGPYAGWSWRVHRTGAFGEKQSEAKKALPKEKLFSLPSVPKTDQFLDSLEAFLVTHRLKEAPDHLKIDIDGLRYKARVSRVRRPAPGSPVLSDEEFEAAMRSLQPAFDDAAECGVEPQMRRFAELTVFVGLHVKWAKKRCRLDATFGKWEESILALRYEPDGQFEAKIALHISSISDPATVVTSATARAFGVEVSELDHALPMTGGTASMDAPQTDRYLDALEVFLASHSLPYTSD